MDTYVRVYAPQVREEDMPEHENAQKVRRSHGDGMYEHRSNDRIISGDVIVCG